MSNTKISLEEKKAELPQYNETLEHIRGSL